MIKVADFVQQYKEGKIPNATIIKMAAFKAELEKNAALGGFAGKIMDSGGKFFKTELGTDIKNMGVYGGAMGIGSLLFEAIKGIEGKWQEHKLDQEKRPMFDKVLIMHPELKENEELAMRYFNAILHFNPQLAEEPFSAGAAVKQMMEMHHQFQGPIPETIERQSLIAKNIAQAKPQSDYSTPLGAVFLPFKPQGSSIYAPTIKKPVKEDKNA